MHVNRRTWGQQHVSTTQQKWIRCTAHLGQGIYYVFCTHSSWGWPRSFLPQANHTATRRNSCKQHSGIPGCHPQVAVCHGCHFLNGVTSTIHAHPICITTCGSTCLHMCPLSCHNIYFQDQTAFQCILHRGTSSNCCSSRWAGGWRTSKMRPGSLFITLSKSPRASSTFMFPITSWKTDHTC